MKSLLQFYYKSNEVVITLYYKSNTNLMKSLLALPKSRKTLAQV